MNELELEQYDRDRDALYEDGEPIPPQGVQLEIEFPSLAIYYTVDGKTWLAYNLY